MASAERVEDALEKLLEEGLDGRRGQSGEESGDVVDKNVAFLDGGEGVAVQKLGDFGFALGVGSAMGDVV